MEFEWDPDKSEANIQKHGIDFEDAASVFLKPYVRQRSDRRGERRWVEIGELEGRTVTVAFTMRERTSGGSRYRLISARRASKDEREEYRKEVG